MADRRRGSTLVIVIALLGALLILGMLALTIASQEDVNSEYFADSAKVPGDDDIDVYFDFALRQIILGPHNSQERQSVLYGGRWSLLANMLGHDMAPYNGGGINAIMGFNTTSGQWETAIDMNGDGTPDNANLLDINNSPAATGTLPNFYDAVDNTFTVPSPDVGYSYPDINSPFLQYYGNAPDGNNTTTTQVIIPSYFRPQILPRDGTSRSNWYGATDDTFAARVLRPHKYHRAIATDGTLPFSGALNAGNARYARYISADFPDTSGAGIGAFPSFNPGAQGVWSGSGANYSGLDADTDDDGVNDAIWLDLGFPAEPSSDGGYRIPLFAISLRDADGLINLNAHGNAYGASRPGALTTTRFGGRRIIGPGIDKVFGTSDDDVDGNYTEFISRSNFGGGSHEVNPQWALGANPPDSSDSNYSLLTPHRFFFGHDPAKNTVHGMQELANMEWWFIQMGRLQYGSSASQVIDAYTGKWGELSRLLNGASTKNPSDFPLPGTATVDDNGNIDELTYPPQFQAYHPHDLRGDGFRVAPNSFGKTLMSGKFHNQQWFPVYHGYRGLAAYSNNLNVYLNGADPTWGPMDEPAETILEPEYLSQADDVFPPSEAAALQMSNTDKQAIGLVGRLDKLAPVNMQTEGQRSKFTPIGWDLKAHNQPFYGPPDMMPADPAREAQFRKWEYLRVNTAPPAPTGVNDPYVGGTLDASVDEFPPTYWMDTSTPSATGVTVSDPFRPELRELLRVDPNNPYVKKPQRRLSVNHVLDRDPSNGRLRFRPVQPHTVGLSAAAIGQHGVTRPEQITNTTQQEWLARRDRQKLCRDIYVLLYTLGCGVDLNVLLDNSSEAIYTGRHTATSINPYAVTGNTADLSDHGNQCRMMAQFAVNLVDQMDPDDVITAFEYDTNLANGWGLDDDPFGPDNGDPQPGDRAVVYGVEEQQLCFNEALAIWASRLPSTELDHPQTEWDDQKDHRWLFFELKNVSPRAVDFSSEAWQIVVKPVLPSTLDPANYPNEERRLVFTTGAVGSAANGSTSLYSVAMDNEADTYSPDDAANYTGAVMGNVRWSYFRVNPSEPATDPKMRTLVPRVCAGPLGASARGNPDHVVGGLVDRDLVHDPSGFRVHRALGDNEFADGTIETTDPGTKLFNLTANVGTSSEITSATLPIKVELVLRRRLHPYRNPVSGTGGTATESQARDNPWVAVDRKVITLKVFHLTTDDESHSSIRDKLLTLTSTERQEPLNGAVSSGSNPNGYIAFTPAGGSYNGNEDWRRYILNSVGWENFCTTTGDPANPPEFHLWHHQLSRPFATPAELLSVPLYNPGETTRRVPFLHKLTPITFPEYEVDDAAAVPPTYKIAASNQAGSYIAASRFLRPDAGDAADPVKNNRWHRILEFLNVPDHWHRSGYLVDGGITQTGTQDLGPYRVPGKMQLNMIRHPEALAALLDDPYVIGLGGAAPFLKQLTNLTDPDRDPNEDNRDWWYQFLRSRDGYDPVSGFLVPGVPPVVSSPNQFQGSRPFRDPGFAPAGTASLDQTVYRSLPMDFFNGKPTRRGLFEVGSFTADTLGNHTVREELSSDIRYRLLGKVANNTTTRTNVYHAFVRVDFFDAAEVTEGGKTWYRIGARRTTDTSHRGFFVIDRSKAFDLLQAGDMPQFGASAANTFSFNQNFNFRSLVLHRQTIR